MAQTTVKRTSICLTKESLRQLHELQEELGENSSNVISRALQLFYYKRINSPRKEKQNGSTHKL